MDGMVGLSTGAVARGDVHLGIKLARQHGIELIELSALRLHELPSVLDAVSSPELKGFRYVSLHLPSALDDMSDVDLIQQIEPVRDRVDGFVVHPDIMTSWDAWRSLGTKLVVENLDARTRRGAYAADFAEIFRQLPEARLCVDVAHLRSVDPTLSECVLFAEAFKDRLAQIHISDLSSGHRHRRIAPPSAEVYSEMLEILGEDVPVMIEAPLTPDEIEGEIRTVQAIIRKKAPRPTVSPKTTMAA